MKATIYATAAALATTVQAAQKSQFVMYSPGGDLDVVERADAIVTPGKISAHVHQIFGASNAGPEMTYESLQQSECSTVGSASHDGNSQDKSVYWHPSLFAEGKDGSGYLRIWSEGHKLYYRDVGNSADQKADPFEFPKNFHMVAGDQTRRVAHEDPQKQLIVEWQCHTTGGIIPGVDQKSGFPKDISNCDQYPGLVGSVHFPHCWNGKESKVNDNTHMSYPEGDPQGGPCPSSHPIRLPHIFMENFFNLKSIYDKIVPNTFVLSQGDPTGYAMHADFFNGWDMGAIPALFDSCPQPWYGNSDVGLCPNFKGFPTKTLECKLQHHYKEEVNVPGEYLPGCNPIVTKSPAPKMKPAPLGVCSNDCVPASAPNNVNGYASHNETAQPNAPGDDKPSPPPKMPPTPSAPTYSAPTSVDHAAPPPSAPHGGDAPAAYIPKGDHAPLSYLPQDDDDEDVLYVTQLVTVTDWRRNALPTAMAQPEHVHRHKRHVRKI